VKKRAFPFLKAFSRSSLRKILGTSCQSLVPASFFVGGPRSSSHKIPGAIF
jgi:hypothetical protein